MEINYNGNLIKLILHNKVWYGGENTLTTIIFDAIDNIDMKNKTVLDIGCGTGIMSIYALKKGAKSVTCVDILPEAIECTKQNLAINSYDGNVFLNNLSENITDKFDVIIANLPFAIQQENLDTIRKNMHKDSVIIISWESVHYIYPRIEELTKGYEIVNVVEDLGWNSYTLKRRT